MSLKTCVLHPDRVAITCAAMIPVCEACREQYDAEARLYVVESARTFYNKLLAAFNNPELLTECATTQLEVFEPGTEVFIGGDIEATIQTVNIHVNGHVTYEVIWWDGRERMSEFVERFEIKPQSTKTHAVVNFLPARETK